MRIGCTADLHGHLPNIPECDLLVIAGDICPASCHEPGFQLRWMDTKLRRWLEKSPAKHICSCAGNHDFVFQDHGPAAAALGLPWTYLQDSGATVAGLRCWGSPWTAPFFDWAFLADAPARRRIWAAVPDDTELLVSHGPPHGGGDMTRGGGGRVGCLCLADRVREVRPRLLICGHIHEDYGVYRLGSTTVVNAAHVGLDYRPRNSVVVVEWDGDGVRVAED